MTKESPFLVPFNNALVKLREAGVIQNIMKIFAPQEDNSILCEPKKVESSLFFLNQWICKASFFRPA